MDDYIVSNVDGDNDYEKANIECFLQRTATKICWMKNEKKAHTILSWNLFLCLFPLLFFGTVKSFCHFHMRYCSQQRLPMLFSSLQCFIYFFLYLYLNILLKICFFRPEFAVWLVRKFVRVLFFTLRFAFGAFTVIRLKCSYLQHFARWHRWCARARCLCVRNENRVHTHTRIRAQFQCTLSRTHWCTHQWQILLNEKCAIFTLARDLCDCMIIIVFSTVRLFPTQQLHQRTHDEEKKNHTHSEWEETMKQKIQKLNAKNGRKKAHEWNRIYDIASLILCAKREKEMNLNRIVARCVWWYCVCLTLWLQCITPYHQYS